MFGLDLLGHVLKFGLLIDVSFYFQITSYISIDLIGNGIFKTGSHIIKLKLHNTQMMTFSR